MAKKNKTKPVQNVTNVIEFLGLEERAFPRHLIGRHTGGIAIIGTGRCVWSDVAGLSQPEAVMTLNDMAMYWPGVISHAYSNDIEQLIHWAAGRRRPYANIFGYSGMLHSATKRGGLEYKDVQFWPLPSQGGSGLVAILVSLLLGYDNITLAGMPFDNSGHFFDPPLGHNLRKDRNWSNFLTETPDALLERMLPLFRGRVHPLSGRLKDMLDG